MRGWDELKFVPKMSNRDVHLRSNVLEWIHHELETMEEHLGLARDAFAEIFTARTTRAIYWLTVAVAILTVVQGFANDHVRTWLSSTLNALRKSVPTRNPQHCAAKVACGCGVHDSHRRQTAQLGKTDWRLPRLAVEGATDVGSLASGESAIDRCQAYASDEFCGAFDLKRDSSGRATRPATRNDS
jgi:hypothetical protein